MIKREVEIYYFLKVSSIATAAVTPLAIKTTLAIATATTITTATALTRIATLRTIASRARYDYRQDGQYGRVVDERSYGV